MCDLISKSQSRSSEQSESRSSSHAIQSQRRSRKFMEVYQRSHSRSRILGCHDSFYQPDSRNFKRLQSAPVAGCPAAAATASAAAVAAAPLAAAACFAVVLSLRLDALSDAALPPHASPDKPAIRRRAIGLSTGSPRNQPPSKWDQRAPGPLPPEACLFILQP